MLWLPDLPVDLLKDQTLAQSKKRVDRTLRRRGGIFRLRDPHGGIEHRAIKQARGRLRVDRSDLTAVDEMPNSFDRSCKARVLAWPMHGWAENGRTVEQHDPLKFGFECQLDVRNSFVKQCLTPISCVFQIVTKTRSHFGVDLLNYRLHQPTFAAEMMVQGATGQPDIGSQLVH